jgi:type IV pilus assembly protein PilC
MKLSLREKRDFYHGLGRLLDSGTSMQASLKTLRTGAGSAQRKLIAILKREIDAGKTLVDSFAAAKPAVSPLEIGVMQAGERSGRMSGCCRYLSDYFERLEAVRTVLWKKSAYPLFVFHLGVLVMALPSLLGAGGVHGASVQVLRTFAVAYGIGFLLFWLGKSWLRMAGVSPTADRLLQAIPLFGNTRKCLTACRFCGTYEMQLQAGVNTMDALRSAAQASQSAIFIKATKRIQGGLREGKKAGDLLEREAAFPRRMVQGIKLGEETGYLDQELARLAKDYEQKGVHWLEMIGEWLPRAVYLFVLLYSAWQVVSLYDGVMQNYQKLLN